MKYTTYFTLLVSVFVAGCAEHTPYDIVLVNGTVLVDNQPIEGINVTFSPIDANVGNAAGGTTDTNGKFKMTTAGIAIGRGAVPGKYNVTFSKITTDDAGMTPEEITQKFGRGHIQFVYDLLPDKYKNPKTSGIEPVTVVKNGKNEFSFSLSMEGYEAEQKKRVADHAKLPKQQIIEPPSRGGRLKPSGGRGMGGGSSSLQ